MQVREVWLAGKGRQALQYTVPPLSWDGFRIHLNWISGTAPRLAVTNHQNLVFIDPKRVTCEPCIEPLGKQQEIFLVSGISPLHGFSPLHEQYTVAGVSDGTFVVMSGKCRFRERLCVKFPDSFPYDASHMVVSKDAVLWLWKPDGVLYAIDILKSEIIEKWNHVSGIASTERGEIYIAAPAMSFLPSAKTVRMSGDQVSEELLSRGIIPKADTFASFVGIDRWGASYWWIEQRKASYIARLVHGKGTVRFLSIRGSASVVKHLRTERSQIDSVCVSEEGSIYFVGYNYFRRSHVCVYEGRLV